MPESKVRKARKPAYQPPARSSVVTPSPPWFGWTIVVLLLLAVAWIVSFSLGPLPGQSALGNWNYLVAIGLAITGVGMLTRWR